MKLRNKITNKICDAEAREDGIYLKTNWADGEEWHKYGLGCLGDNWEYYVGPKEPLIKNEKIRKTVKSFFALLGTTKEIYYQSLSDSFRHTDDDGITYSVYFDNNRDVGDIDTDRAYTIAELCGEEEE